jgi:hypothetical protein
VANQQRGEISLELGGKNYTLRPSFGALCEIEERLNISIPNLIIAFENGDLRIKSIATIIWGGMWAVDPKAVPTIPEVGEMILKDGLMNVINQVDEDNGSKVAGFLINGIVGDKDDAKKKETGEVANLTT